jgi:hypothetical protein
MLTLAKLSGQKVKHVALLRHDLMGVEAENGVYFIAYYSSETVNISEQSLELGAHLMIGGGLC